jgi:hypothetical protein
MAIIEQELDDFTRFARDRMNQGESDLTIDELFDLWRAENPSPELYSENVAAVNASIRDFQAGERGTVAGRHSDELRREFGMTDE